MEFIEKNPKCFYELSEFKQLTVLENNYDLILTELNSLRGKDENGHWKNSFPHYLNPKSKSFWQIFSFRFFGIRHPLNCSLCPQTAALLNTIAGLVSADFSYLPPHTHINPHKGFTKMVLRVHLGLIIPKDCGIRVGNETKKWQVGKLIIFDDSYEHEAWNDSDEDRFVLMLDIANPLWNYSAEEICGYKIENMEDDFMLEMFTKEQWKDFYKQGEFTVFPAK